MKSEYKTYIKVNDKNKNLIDVGLSPNGIKFMQLNGDVIQKYLQKLHERRDKNQINDFMKLLSELDYSDE
jgi:hypothetical protein